MFCVYLFILSVVVLSSEISIPTFKYTEAEVEVGFCSKMKDYGKK